MDLLIPVFLCITALGVFFYAAKEKNRGNNNEYDERQIAARGKGYKVGFFTALIGFVVLILFDVAEIQLPLVETARYIILFFISIGTFVVYCIMNDAYIGLHTKCRSNIVLWLIIVAFETFQAVRDIIDGEMVKDGMITGSVITIALVILLLVIMTAMLIRSSQIKKGEAEEDEES
ncbi:MAG: hypothetical protein J6X60_08770 [Ruminiclostridium sp.]|nr:hypothetical protein [Ruminiclostridium sp.]